jgi:hypothetical protein
MVIIKRRCLRLDTFSTTRTHLTIVKLILFSQHFHFYSGFHSTFSLIMAELPALRRIEVLLPFIQTLGFFIFQYQLRIFCKYLGLKFTFMPNFFSSFESASYSGELRAFSSSQSIIHAVMRRFCSCLYRDVFANKTSHAAYP